MRTPESSYRGWIQKPPFGEASSFLILIPSVLDLNTNLRLSQRCALIYVSTLSEDHLSPSEASYTEVGPEILPFFFRGGGGSSYVAVYNIVWLCSKCTLDLRCSGNAI